MRKQPLPNDDPARNLFCRRLAAVLCEVARTQSADKAMRATRGTDVGSGTPPAVEGGAQ
jgi:hypothetical protein